MALFEGGKGSGGAGAVVLAAGDEDQQECDALGDQEALRAVRFRRGSAGSREGVPQLGSDPDLQARAVISLLQALNPDNEKKQL